LGRGLEALITGVARVEGEVGLIRLRPEQIAESGRQPRTSVPEEGIDDLAGSIAQHGVLQPLIVRPPREDGKYELVAGERRWRAAQKAGIVDIPVLVWDITDREALELALVENLQREDLKPLECARAFQALMEEFGMTQEAVAARLGKSRSSVANSLRLLSLPDRAQQALDSGEISEGHARALLRIEGIDRQVLALQAMIEKSMSVRDAERLAKRYAKGEIVSRETISERLTRSGDPNLIDAEQRLRMRLGTMVRILRSASRGMIEVEFYSDEDLERILATILSKS